MISTATRAGQSARNTLPAVTSRRVPIGSCWPRSVGHEAAVRSAQRASSGNYGGGHGEGCGRTGANQGLGLALVRGLCRALGAGGIVYLTARDRARGERAVAELQAEGLSPRLEVLDVRDDASVTGVAQALAGRHGDVDVVISNAAARISPRCRPSSRSAPSSTPTTTAPCA